MASEAREQVRRSACDDPFAGFASSYNQCSQRHTGAPLGNAASAWVK